MISFVPVRPLSFPGSCSPPLHRHSSIPTWVRRVWLFLHHHFVNTHGSIEICRRSHDIDTPHPVAREHVLEAESTRPETPSGLILRCHAMLDRPSSTRVRPKTFQRRTPPVVVWYTGHFHCYLLRTDWTTSKKGFPEIVWSSLHDVSVAVIVLVTSRRQAHSDVAKYASLWPSGRDMVIIIDSCGLLRHVFVPCEVTCPVLSNPEA